MARHPILGQAAEKRDIGVVKDEIRLMIFWDERSGQRNRNLLVCPFQGRALHAHGKPEGTFLLHVRLGWSFQLLVGQNLGRHKILNSVFEETSNELRLLSIVFERQCRGTYLFQKPIRRVR